MEPQKQDLTPREGGGSQVRQPENVAADATALFFPDPEDAPSPSSGRRGEDLPPVSCVRGRCTGKYTWTPSRINVLKDGVVKMRCPKCQRWGKPSLPETEAVRMFLSTLGAAGLTGQESTEEDSSADAELAPGPETQPQTHTFKPESEPMEGDDMAEPLNLQMGKEDMEAINSDMKNLRPLFMQTKAERDALAREKDALVAQLRALGVQPGQVAAPMNPGGGFAAMLPNGMLPQGVTPDLLKETGLDGSMKAAIAMRLAKVVEQGMSQMFNEWNSPNQSQGRTGAPQPPDYMAMMQQAQQMAFQMELLNSIMPKNGHGQDQAVMQHLQQQQQQFQQFLQSILPLITTGRQQQGFSPQEWMQWQAMMNPQQRVSPIEQVMVWQAMQNSQNGGRNENAQLGGLMSSIAQQNMQNMQAMANMVQANAQASNQLLVPLITGQTGGSQAFLPPLMAMMQQNQQNDRQWFAQLQAAQQEVRGKESEFWRNEIETIAQQVRGRPETEFEKATKELFFSFLLKQVSGGQMQQNGGGGWMDKLEKMINGPPGQLLVDIVRGAAMGRAPVTQQQAAMLQTTWDQAARDQGRDMPYPAQMPMGVPPVVPPMFAMQPMPLVQAPQMPVVQAPVAQPHVHQHAHAPSQERQLVGKSGNVVEPIPMDGARFMRMLGEDEPRVSRVHVAHQQAVHQQAEQQPDGVMPAQQFVVMQPVPEEPQPTEQVVG